MFCRRKERSISIIHAHIYNTETERSSLKCPKRGCAQVRWSVSGSNLHLPIINVVLYIMNGNKSYHASLNSENG